MKEVIVSGQVYQINKLPIFQQFHIARIMAPVIFAGPKMAIMMAFARLSDRDAEYVVNSCLEVIQRKQEANWANVGTLGRPMFSDMVLLDFYELAAACINGSLSGFFPGLLSKITAATTLEA